jgi:fumarylpyruvate hydrolase
MKLVAAIGRGGTDIDEVNALDHAFGYAAGPDMTRRDLQVSAKKAGRPWDMSKGFEHSAPIGDILPAATIGDPASGLIELKVNGKLRQSSDLSKMTWRVPETIACLPRQLRLGAGDLIMTGPPAGVAAVVRGDLLEGMIAGVGSVRTKIV